MENFDSLQHEVLKFEFEVPFKDAGLEFMLVDSLRQPEEPEIQMAEWNAYIIKKLEKIKALMVIVLT